MRYDIGFIGCGNMGGALCKSVAKLEGVKIAVCDKDSEKVNKFVNDYGCYGVTSYELALNSDVIVLGVKPQVILDAMSEIVNAIKSNENAFVVSMAAGVTVDTVSGSLSGAPVIRIMPNTPCNVGEGMIVYSLSKNATKEHKEKFLKLFSKAGLLYEIKEEKIDAACALSGCGPAFSYMFIKGLINAGIDCGLTENEATTFAVQTVKGASEMVKAFGDVDGLIKAVCSPNGATIEGVKKAEEMGFYSATESAVKSSYKRTLELKK